MDNAESVFAAAQFARAATILGGLLKARQGDRVEAEAALQELESAYLTLEAIGAQALLLPLLQSHDEYVAVLAAKLLLLYDERASSETLKMLAQRKTNVGFLAKLKLARFRGHFLTCIERVHHGQATQGLPA